MNDLEDKLQIDSMVGKVNLNVKYFTGLFAWSFRIALQENTKLSRLRDKVEKYHDLSNSMSSILTTFEHRLGKLEQTILPVYNETEHLQNRFKSMLCSPQVYYFTFTTFDLFATTA